MRYDALLGWGIVIYAVVYLVWSALVAHGFVEGIIPRVVGLVALISVTAAAARAIRVIAWRDALPYACGWVLVVAACDVVMSVPFAGWQMYSDWNIWVGYALVFVVPLFVISVRRRFSIPSA